MSRIKWSSEIVFAGVLERYDNTEMSHVEQKQCRMGSWKNECVTLSDALSARLCFLYTVNPHSSINPSLSIFEAEQRNRITDNNAYYTEKPIRGICCNLLGLFYWVSKPDI